MRIAAKVGEPGRESQRKAKLNMDKRYAIEMKEHGVRAIKELMDLLNIAFDRCSPEECELIKRGVGLSIGRIDVDLLSIIYQQYPEIDDLADKPLASELPS